MAHTDHENEPVIPQKPPPPPDRRAPEVPTDDPQAPTQPVRLPPQTPIEAPPTQPIAPRVAGAYRVQAAPRSRRISTRMEIPAQPIDPEVVGRQMMRSDPLMLLAFRPSAANNCR